MLPSTFTQCYGGYLAALGGALAVRPQDTWSLLGSLAGAVPGAGFTLPTDVDPFQMSLLGSVVCALGIYYATNARSARFIATTSVGRLLWAAFCCYQVYCGAWESGMLLFVADHVGSVAVTAALPVPSKSKRT